MIEDDAKRSGLHEEVENGLGLANRGLLGRIASAPDLEQVAIANRLLDLASSFYREFVRADGAYHYDWSVGDVELLSIAVGDMDPSDDEDVFAMEARQLVEALTTVADHAIQSLVSLPYEPEASTDAAISRLSNLIGVARSIGGQVDARQASRAISRVETAADSAEDLSGKGSVGALADHFEKFASEEGRRMVVLRSVGSLAIITSCVAAGAMAVKLGGLDLGAAESLKLLVTLPVLLLGSYLLREAGHHRHAAQQARENAVRLRTIRPFTEELPDDQQAALRIAFGTRLFTHVEAAPAQVEPVVSALDSVARLITSLRGAKP